MIRNILIVFVLGWAVWFAMDKNSPEYYVVHRPPPVDGLIQELQLGVDLVKMGRVGPAFAFLWNAHYILISVIAGALLSLLTPSLAGLGRRIPRGSKQTPADKDVSTPKGKE